MSQTYFAILTDRGEAKLANAQALGTQVQYSHMAVGDGNGNLPVPDRLQPALVREQYRAGLNELKVDPLNASQIIAELVIPENIGGWWIREMGIYDADGDLVAVANCPPSYKPQLAEGSGRTQVLRIVLIVSSTAAVQLKIDPSVVLATREYVLTTVTALLADTNPVMAGAASPGAAAKAARSDHRHPTDTSRAPLASPGFTGTPTAPTPAATDKTTKVATTEFVRRAIGDSEGGIALPVSAATDAATDFNALNQPGWHPNLLGGAAGARNANHPDGQAAIGAGNGVVNYYWSLLAKHSNNLFHLALPYVSGPDLSLATIRFRLLGGGEYSSWRSLWHSENLKEATKEEAEAGALQGARWLSPLRALQLLRAAAANANEALRGVLRVATQVEVDAGALDDVAVTPKKLFNGALIVTSTYMALKLPSWLGGYILQRGSVSIAAEGGASVSVTLPLAYTTSYSALATFCYTGARVENSNYAQPRDKTLNGFTLDNQWAANGSNLAGTIDFFTFGK